MNPNPNLWFLAVGILLVAMALTGSVLKRLPLSGSMFYLAAGFALGPSALGLLTIDPVGDSDVLERVTEVAVIISLFTAGLKLRTPLMDLYLRRKRNCRGGEPADVAVSTMDRA